CPRSAIFTASFQTEMQKEKTDKNTFTGSPRLTVQSSNGTKKGLMISFLTYNHCRSPTLKEFLECYIFPVLLPGMVELLHEAKKQRCFERKQTRFIALDFLTEWLYNHNAKRRDEPFVEFFEIPFVKDWLKDHPRPPIPLSLLLTEKDASHIIQTFWKGYRVRCHPEVQELRQWQKHLRETKNIHRRVREFWMSFSQQYLFESIGLQSTLGNSTRV
uniref:IQ motif containing K n=1 Tax=Pseudonaja textilis TaxID=8673 RepID=A0A670YLZ2_PSETE